LGAIEYDRLDVLGGQQRGNLFGDSSACQSNVGDDQRFAKAVVGDSDHRLIEATGAHHVHCGDEEGAAHGEFPCDCLKVVLAASHLDRGAK